MLTTTLKALNHEIVEAGTMRDGTSVARLTTVLNVLYEMQRDATARQVSRINPVLQAAYRTLPFCKIHDRAARKEIDGGAEYRDALAAAREADARFAASIAA